MASRASGGSLEGGARNASCRSLSAALTLTLVSQTVANEECVKALRRLVDGWALKVEERAGPVTSVWHQDDRAPSVQDALPPSGPGHLAGLSVTENPAFSKAVRVCAHLVCEAWRLRDEVHRLCVPALLVAGDSPASAGERSDAHVALDVAHLLPRLQHVLDVAHQVGATALNVGHQLAAVYGDASRAHAPLQAVRLKALITAMGTCLALLATLDAACDANPGLAAGVGAMRRGLAAQQTPPADSAALDGALRELEMRAVQQSSFLGDWYADACRGGPVGDGSGGDAAQQPLPCVREQGTCRRERDAPPPQRASRCRPCGPSPSTRWCRAQRGGSQPCRARPDEERTSRESELQGRKGRRGRQNAPCTGSPSRA